MKTNVLILACVVFVCLPVSVHAIGLGAAVGAWRQSPSGQFAYEPLGPNSILDIDEDLNYDNETRPMGWINIDMPLIIPNIYVSATPMEFDGTGDKTFKFGDIIVDGAFESKLTLDHLDVALYYGIPLLETATLNTLNIDIGLNVRIFDLETTITELASGTTETESVTLPLPMVFVAVQFRPIDAISIEAEGRGISISDNKAFSLIGRLRWNALGPFFLAGGYRYDKYDIDEEGILVDADFSGPFAELGFEF
jgi:outer membrane protein